MILVTGGTGLVGAAVVRELARRARPVAVLSRDAVKVAARFPGLQVAGLVRRLRTPPNLNSGLRSHGNFESYNSARRRSRTKGSFTARV